MNALRALATLAAGMLFGFGLSVSTMVRPEVVLSFLRLNDMGLMLVMGGAVAVVLLAYQFAPRVLRRVPRSSGLSPSMSIAFLRWRRCASALRFSIFATTARAEGSTESCSAQPRAAARIRSPGTINTLSRAAGVLKKVDFIRFPAGFPNRAFRQ